MRLFVRRDLQGRECLGHRRAASRPRLHRAAAAAAVDLFEERFNGESVDYHLSLRRDGPGAVPLHRARPRGRDPRRLARPSSSARWSTPRAHGTTGCRDALVAELRRGAGHALARRYAGAASPSTTRPRPRSTGPRSTSASSSGWASGGRTWSALQNERGAAEPLTRLKLYKTGGKAQLSDLLPMLEDAGPDGGRGGADAAAASDERRRAATCTTSACSAPDGRPLDLSRWASWWPTPSAPSGTAQAESRLAQPAGAGGRPDLAAGRDPARLPAVPAGARRRLHQALPERRLRAERRAWRASWCSCSSCGSTPTATAGEADGRGARGRDARQTWTRSPASTTTASCAASSA